ncbi:MAG: hypothetical protein HN978_21865 [Desulfobacula sp.]|jgi:hypothetical protein|nr:hypothetical protein [Desulfobacula sp.]
MRKKQKRKWVEYALIGAMGGMAASGFSGSKPIHIGASLAFSGLTLLHYRFYRPMKWAFNSKG